MSKNSSDKLKRTKPDKLNDVLSDGGKKGVVKTKSTENKANACKVATNEPKTPERSPKIAKTPPHSETKELMSAKKSSFKEAKTPPSPDSSKIARTPPNKNGKQDEKTCRETNEMNGIEADAKVNKHAKVMVPKAESIDINDKKYRLSKDILADYGHCEIIEANGTEVLLLHYEWNGCTCKRLAAETEVLECAKTSKRNHIFELLAKGSHAANQIHYIITDTYGPSLSEIRTFLRAQRFSLSTALKLSYITLECIEEFHRLGFVHRDIKPSSFVASNGSNRSKLYIVHFGLARRFRTKDAGHLPQRSSVPCVGSLRYTSRRSHEKLERSRKDDVESWVYMICEFFEPDALTWGNLKKADAIYKAKDAFMSSAGIKRAIEKCTGLPRAMNTLARLVNVFQYDTAPDYRLFKAVFRNAIIQGNFKGEKLDWMKNVRQLADGKDDDFLNNIEAGTARDGYFELGPVDSNDCGVDDILERSANSSKSKESSKPNSGSSRSSGSEGKSSEKMKSSKTSTPSRSSSTPKKVPQVTVRTAKTAKRGSSNKLKQDKPKHQRKTHSDGSSSSGNRVKLTASMTTLCKPSKSNKNSK